MILEEWKTLVLSLNPSATFTPLYCEAHRGEGAGAKIVGVYREEGPSYADGPKEEAARCK